MILRGIDFGCVMNASGARNFFGQGYPFHRWWHNFGLDYTNATFVAKTTTLKRNVGNMPFVETTLQPQEIFPKCIKVNPMSGAVLNAVGLSGPGVESLLQKVRWQRRRDPFFISFAAIEKTVPDRLNEWKEFCELLCPWLSGFRAPIGLEMNFSCPNTGIIEQPFVDEIHAALDIASVLDVPLVAKLNVLIPPAVGFQIAEHGACDAICQSNTISWNLLSDLVKKKFFNRLESPLKKYGGGGFSGPYLFPLVLAWIREAKVSGLKKPIIGCGGIMSVLCADMMFAAGARAIQIGSVSITRPWRVQSIIKCANNYGGK